MHVKKKEERDEWSNQCEFILSTLGLAVGLGNVWRFPTMVYENGGGSFLIPYLIMLLLAGLPLFFMELVLGQYCRQGPIRVFGRIAPIFKGVGLAMLGANALVNIYYNVIIGWTLFYMFKGFTSILPWSTCHEPHAGNATMHCVENFTSLNESTIPPAMVTFSQPPLVIDAAITFLVKSLLVLMMITVPLTLLITEVP